MENQQPLVSGKNKKTLWTILAIVAIFIYIVYMLGKYGLDNSSPASTPPVVQQQEAKNEAPAPQAVFDVPSLIGKNIDEVKTVLGAPTTYKEPTKKQLEFTDIWDMEYTKDDTNLLITFNPKNKAILDFFIDGSDKTKLLALGKLQEKDDSYIAEFVKSITNPNEITGVKVYKKLPQELDGNVTYNAIAFKIENKDNYGWTNCKFSINSKFDFKSADGIKANDSVIIPFSEFTNDGVRFDFFTNKPESLFISCDTLGQHRSNYFTIN